MIALPPGFQVSIALFFAGLLIGSSVSWYLTGTYKDASWEASVNAINIAAEQALRQSIERTHALEMKQLQRFNELEVAHAKDVEALSRIKTTNRDLATQLGGLRDPGRRPSCDCTMSKEADPSGVHERGSASANLSAEATNFLLDFADDADRAALYAAKCKAITMTEFDLPTAESAPSVSTHDQHAPTDLERRDVDSPRDK
jgi:hypothetical protein